METPPHVLPAEHRPAVDACQWLSSLLRAHEGDLPGLRSWSVQPGDDRVFATLALDEEQVVLHARRPDGLPSWVSAGGVAFNVDCKSDPVPAETQGFLEALRAVLHRSPAAELTFPQGAAAMPQRRAEPGSALQKRLHRAAFFAWKVLDTDKRVSPPIQRHDGEQETTWRTLVLQEFYPYVGALGEPVPEETVREGWRRTADRVREGTAPKHLGLYVHFPYCATRCRFCYCAVTDNLPKGSIQQYVDTVVASMREYGEIVRGLPVSSVFVGGGTPSMMSLRMMEQWFGTLHECFDIPRTTQVTVETNPDSLTDDKVELMERVGHVTRLTIGIQSIDPETQRRANRYNDPAKIRRLAELCHERGILLNMDVMAGMDGQTFEAFQRDVEFALTLRPDSLHLSGFRPIHITDSSHDAEQVQRRRKMLAWGLAALRDQGIEPRLGMPPTRDEKAVNAQIVEWRDHNANLLAIGTSGYGHSYGSHFYETCRGYETTGGMDVALGQLRVRGNTFYAIPSDDAEEEHRFLVHNIQGGFSVSHFRALFGKDPWDVCPEPWEQLVELGAISVEGDRVVGRMATHAERSIFAVFLYSQSLRDRMERHWGAEYDPAAPYEELVRDICAGST